MTTKEVPETDTSENVDTSDELDVMQRKAYQRAVNTLLLSIGLFDFS